MASVRLKSGCGSIQTLSQPHSNLDYWYGPYFIGDDANNPDPSKYTSYLTLEALEDALKRNADVGFTVGIVDENETLVAEYWFKEKDHLDKKIEEYELVLEKFEGIEAVDPSDGEKKIKLTYILNGRGINTRVSISNTQHTNINFSNYGEEKTVWVSKQVPNNYSFTFSAYDALGTLLKIKAGVHNTIVVGFGSLLRTNLVVDNKIGKLPRALSYENCFIRFAYSYNPTIISEIKLMFNNTEQVGVINYTSNNTFSGEFKFPENSSQFQTGANVLKLTYRKNNVDTESEIIYTANVLGLNEYQVIIDDVLKSAASPSTYSFYLTLQYGGDVDVYKLLTITTPNNSNIISTSLRIRTNVKLKINLVIPENLIGTYNLVFAFEDNVVPSFPKSLEIKKASDYITPKGEYYFNKSKNVANLNNFTWDSELVTITENTLSWDSDTLIPVYTIGLCNFFNLDFYIDISQNGLNDPLIIIRDQNDPTNILFSINRQTIESGFYSGQSGILLRNNLPITTEKIHIGLGYLRKINNQSWYNCIFINGEIAFCSELLNTINTPNIEICFLNSFTLEEFCLSINNSLQNAITSSDEWDTSYNIINGSKDVFYYNWRTCLEDDQILSKGENLEELKLYPIKVENNLKNDLMEIINNLQTSFETKPFKKAKHFVGFGERITNIKESHGEPNGPLNLLEISSADKEDYKLDKLNIVLCKYSLNEFNPNKYCIVQVQGTSTLTYPIPNFLFTFLEKEGNNWTIDSGVTLTYDDIEYTYDPLAENVYDQNILSGQIEGEINLVAKADSMDSSHLNNTPTGIYYSSLLRNFNKINLEFVKFDSNYNDTIVGKPIILKVCTSPMSIDTLTVDNYNTFENYGTFMLNTGKDAANMGLSNSNIFSLEGLSNTQVTLAGMFDIPAEPLPSNMNYVNEMIDIKANIISTLNNSENTLDTIIEELDNTSKKSILGYLLNEAAFESRGVNKLEFSDSSDEISELWNNMKPFVKAWWFVHLADDTTFANEFTTYFDLDYAILYYIHLVLFGLVDNLGKNMMLDWKNEGNSANKIYIRPYDMDSSFGLNNNGFDSVLPYSCPSYENFLERLQAVAYTGISADNEIFSYNSTNSILWKKFWKAFLSRLKATYNTLRSTWITPENIINIGTNLVYNKISKEQYNTDFYLKHFGTKYCYLNKGSRFDTYKDWITKRFMYTDSFFNYTQSISAHGNDKETIIEPTLIPVFYEVGTLETIEGYYYGNKEVNIRAYNNSALLRLVCVPESIIGITSPLSVDNFPNLQKYSGPVIEEFPNHLALLSIEFISGTVNNTIVFPEKINKLSLKNLTISSDLGLNNENFPNLEELNIENCQIETEFSISGLTSLRTLNIINTNFVTDVELLDLQLSHISIYNNTFEDIQIEGTITINKVLSLPALKCNNLIILDSNLEEINIDLSYVINNERYTVYDTIDSVIYANKALHEDSFILTLPEISTLSITNCSDLKTFSGIGLQLNNLTLPFTIRTLNIQFSSIKRLNGDADGTFDCRAFSNLYSRQFTVFGKTHSWASIADDTPGFNFMTGYIVPASFNVLGCKNLTTLKLSSANNAYRNFTGENFVNGCLYLTTIENLPFGNFTTLKNSFRCTPRLTSSGINNFSNNSTSFNSISNLAFAFSYTGLNIGDCIEKVKNYLVNAQSIFAGNYINLNLTINAQWKNCSNIFSIEHIDIDNHPYENDEYIFLNPDYAVGDPPETRTETYTLDITLPNCTSIYRLVYGQKVKANSLVLPSTTALAAYACFANTDLDQILDTHTYNIQLYSFFYLNCPLMTPTESYEDLFSHNAVNVNGLFSGCTELALDANLLFANCPSIIDASGCFCNTKCYCTGNPFYSGTNKKIDISGMFAITNNTIIPDVDKLCNVHWIDDKYIISSWFTIDESLGQMLDNGGVFLGRRIALTGDFTVPNAGGTDLTHSKKRNLASKFFKNCNISAPALTTITLNAKDCSGVLEGATFGETISVNGSVEILDNAFKSSRLGTIILNSSVTSANSLFENAEQLTNITGVFDSRLKYANRMFKDYKGEIPNGFFITCTGLLLANRIFENYLKHYATLSPCSALTEAAYAFYNSKLYSDGNYTLSSAKLTEIKGMFRECDFNNLSSLQITLNENGVIDASELFYGVKNLENDTQLSISSTNLEAVNAITNNNIVTVSISFGTKTVLALLTNSDNGNGIINISSPTGGSVVHNGNWNSSSTGLPSNTSLLTYTLQSLPD